MNNPANFIYQAVDIMKKHGIDSPEKLEDSLSPSYFAIIPVTVLQRTDLTPTAKLLYAEISALTKKKGFCYATNKYLGKKIGVATKSISTMLKQLSDTNLVDVDIKRSFEGTFRTIRIIYGGGGQTKQGGGGTEIIAPKEILTNRNIQKNYSSQDMRLAKILYTLIKQNSPTHREPNFDKWANDVRKIRTLDGRTSEQIEAIMRWAQKDDFWQSIILSPSNLRKQFDALVIKTKRGGRNRIIIA